MQQVLVAGSLRVDLISLRMLLIKAVEPLNRMSCSKSPLSPPNKLLLALRAQLVVEVAAVLVQTLKPNSPSILALVREKQSSSNTDSKHSMTLPAN